MLQELNDGGRYVLNLDVAITMPKILDIREKPVAKELIIPFDVFNSKLFEWKDDNNDRGAASMELAIYLQKIASKAEIDKNNKWKKSVLKYTFPTGEIIYLDPINHNCPSKRSTLRTIACAKAWDATLVTFDASVYNIVAEDEKAKALFIVVKPYKGYRIVKLPIDCHARWLNKGFTDEDWAKYFENEEPLHPNEFVEFIFQAPANRPNRFNNIGMYNDATHHLDHLQTINQWPIMPIGARQAMAFEAIYQDTDRITAVFLVGKGGSGKTFSEATVAITESNELKDASDYYEEPTKKSTERKEQQRQKSKQRKSERRATREEQQLLASMTEEEMQSYFEKKEKSDRKTTYYASNVDKEYQKSKRNYPYKQVYICPPDKMLGDKQPALPGGEFEKRRSKIHGFAANCETVLRILHPDLSYHDASMRTESFLRRCVIIAPGETNGDDISDALFILDEAQFMQLSQIRMSIQRINQNAKILISGDPTQRMNQYGAADNALSKAVEICKYHPHIAIITFDKGDEIQRPGARIIDECWPE
jgi:predicted ribonuclease YlaK